MFLSNNQGQLVNLTYKVVLLQGQPKCDSIQFYLKIMIMKIHNPPEIYFKNTKIQKVQIFLFTRNESIYIYNYI